MSNKEINVAVIGFGMAGQVFHAPLITATPGLNLKGIVTANEDRQRLAKQTYPQITLYDSTEALLKDADEYNLVVVASPNRYHAPQAISCLEHGLAVVVDKPMAVTAKECQDVIKASKQSGALLTVFQNRRFDGNFLTIKRIIEKDLLGPICRFESRYERYRPVIKDNAWREIADPANAGGLLYDLGTHIIDQAILLFGTPKTVYAEIDKKRPGAQVDDDVFIALEFPQAIRAHLWTSMLSKIPGPRFHINGLQGSYEKYGFDPQEDALRAGTLPLDSDWGKEPEENWGILSTSINGKEQESKYEPLPGCYQRFYSQLRDAIANKTAPPVLPEESLLTMQVIEACMHSAKTNQVIQFSNELANVL